MFIASPETALRFAREEDGQLEDGLHYWFRGQREAVSGYLNNRDAQPSASQLRTAAEFLEKTTGLSWSVEQIREVLSLYPRTRITLAVDGEAEDELSFAVAHFFLGTSWPTFGDRVDVTAFVDVLQQQALLMGYSKAN
ncbi:hypothetical protein EFK68_03800 [Pseudomonas aeruginosa]|uniref:hypothetical protein n=1 Tax=Pseudomonas aeruginosa TaxID=287 RepID=UPI000F6AD2C9|nr:hypothetical protein [Pseudomonas aeruginosa]EKF7416904.1 hypothetical protein [Pseudomonas aeruginosa]MDS9918393.1 hypothetical protein [Pseudomonas aeruginosa]RNF58509.1 hypothetical protein EFK68_03800 [Pseudomonas aeruginosa]